MLTNICMICMILMGLLWSRVYARSSRCENEMLHQSLADLSIGCFEVGTLDVRAFDVVPLIYYQAKGWRPWPEIMIPE